MPNATQAPRPEDAEPATASSESFAEFLDELLPEGWEHDADIYGMDCTLTCPHGNEVEQDGFSGYCGCRSPLVGVLL